MKEIVLCLTLTANSLTIICGLYFIFSTYKNKYERVLLWLVVAVTISTFADVINIKLCPSVAEHRSVILLADLFNVVLVGSLYWFYHNYKHDDTKG